MVCQSLTGLDKEADAAAATQALKATSKAVLNAPKRITVTGLTQLGELKDEVWADAEFTTALAEFIETVRPSKSPDNAAFGNRLQGVANKGDAEFILQQLATSLILA